MLKESSSDESSDNEKADITTRTTTATTTTTATAAVANDKQPHVAVNSCQNGEAFNGNFVPSWS